MGGVGLVVRAELRHRAVALVLLGVLAGVVGASVVAAVAGARRADTAYDRLAARTGQPDATLISFVDPAFADEVAALPQVESSWRLRGVVGRALAEDTVQYGLVVAGPPRPDGLFEPLVEEGRLPADDRADEVAVADGFARQFGVEVGDRYPIGLLTQEEFESFDEGFGEPDGPTVDLRVVGRFTVGGNDSGESIGLLGSPAFAELAGDGGGGDGVMVRLEDDPGAPAAFAEGVQEVARDFDLPPDAAELGAYDLRLADEDRDRTRSATTVVSRGLLLAALAGLLVGAAGLVQTVLRHESRSLTSRPVLGALGLDWRQRVLGAVLPFAVLGAPVAAAVTVAGALALSPLLPIGQARRLEPSPGVEVNVAILGLGAVATVVVLLGLVAAVVTWRVRRPSAPRRSGVSLLGRSGSVLPLPVAVGAGLALDRGRGGAVVPVRAALTGAVVAVAALVGASAFVLSLDRLTGTPARYGAPGDLVVADVQDDSVADLVGDPDIEAVMELRGFDIEVEGELRDGAAVEVAKGSIGFTFLDGNAPSGPAEVALGAATADRLDVGVGDEVLLDATGSSARVAGIVLARGQTRDSYADVVLVAEEVRLLTSQGNGFREALVRYVDGVDVEAEAAALGEDLEVEVFQPPQRIRDLAQVRPLPLALAGSAALLGLVLLAHALVMTLRRRGHDLALLRALGARPSETAQAVLVMTVVIVVTGVVIGVPLGLLAGNLAWRAVAGSLHVADDLMAPNLVLALVLPVGLVAGLAAAAAPTWRAGRLEVADRLRQE